MITPEELKKIKEEVGEFLEKLTAVGAGVSLSVQPVQPPRAEAVSPLITEVVVIDIDLPDPQLFIGQNGQTLLEIERLLKMVLCKNLRKSFYVNLDINGYKKKKVEYLKKLANDTAREAVMANEKKILPPMSSYERRIIHDELSQNAEVTTESEGDSLDRHVVIKPARNF